VFLFVPIYIEYLEKH